jgi:hypothetical protein
VLHRWSERHTGDAAAYPEAARTPLRSGRLRLSHDGGGFSAFVEEADGNIDDWAVFFVAALPGVANREPTPLAVDEALDRMVESVRIGQVGTYLAFDRSGAPLQFASVN